MTNFYTLISYLEGTSGHIDRCGDFVSGEDSEFFIQTYHKSEVEQLINDYAQQKLSSDNSYREITLLLDGVDTYNHPHSSENLDDFFSDLESERDELEDKVYEKYMSLVEEKKKREEEAKQKALQLKMEKERAYQKKIQDEELKQLEKLQAKYGIRR